MSKAFHILHVEDSCDDADLVRLALLRSGFPCAIRCVDTEPAFIEALDAAIPDVILCDRDMPCFSADRAFAILREKGLGLPFIVVSHHAGRGDSTMDMGADGYLAKSDLGRLSLMIEAAVQKGAPAQGAASGRQ
jgi:CheY-like chemotaxis protein